MNPIFITNDSEAQVILFKAGLLPCLKPEPPYTAVFCQFDCNYQGSRYYALGSYQIGQPDPNENGYSVFLVPAGLMSLAEASEFFADAVRCTSNGPVLTVERDLTPTQN